ncbi:MAG: response regulator transcription factor [Actinomycetota bacterium]|nr:response regulator transcription factor [Actinomycetota bacterium]
MDATAVLPLLGWRRQRRQGRRIALSAPESPFALVSFPITRPEGYQLIRVLIVSDMRIHCESLELALAGHSDLEVVGRTSDYARVIDTILHLAPQIVLLDTTSSEGRATAKQIRASWPTVKVIVLGVEEEQAEVISWAETGMAGYVGSNDALEDLVDVIVSTARGELRCSPRMAATLLQRLGTLAVQASSSTRELDVPLTTREIDVARLIARGLSNKEIARALSIAVPTVKNHVHNILEKLRLPNRAAIASVVDDQAGLEPTGPSGGTVPRSRSAELRPIVQRDGSG